MVQYEAVQHKTQLKNYFDGEGFDRWAAIYSDADNLSFVRRMIAVGHTRMLAIADMWLTDICKSGTIIDVGCGTGLFSVAMARKGYDVTALDISPRMVESTRQGAAKNAVTEKMDFFVGDVESIETSFDAVACFDVLVHYPREPFAEMVQHLAQRSNKTLLLTYAPYNRILAALHRVGGWFPSGNRRTEIQMIPDAVVANAIHDAGMTIHRTASISQGFYHVKLIQATFP